MENQAVQTTDTNAGQALGIVALVLGILGILTAFIPCFGFFALIFGALAIVFGAIGLSQAKQKGGKTGLPMTGLILGIVAVVFTIVWLVVFAGALATGATMLKNIH